MYLPKIYPLEGPLKLHALLGDNPSTRSLRSGAVGSDMLLFDFDESFHVTHDGFRPMVREGRFDWGELAIVTFLQARDRGKPLVLLPAVIGGRFQHHCIAYNRDRGMIDPRDLAGKRIGIRSYTTTTVSWVRGILERDYGLDASTVQWFTTEEPHIAEYVDPPNVQCLGSDAKLAQLLLDGELDVAVLGNKPPENASLVPLIPDPDQAAQTWHERTRITPMNHMAVVKSELAQQRPDAVGELYRMLRQSRDLDVTSAKGLQMRPFSVEALRPSLEAIIDFTFDDGLIGRRLSVDDLFDDTTRALGA